MYRFKDNKFVLQAARRIDQNVCSLKKINRRVVDDRQKLQPKLLGAGGQGKVTYLTCNTVVVKVII